MAYRPSALTSLLAACPVRDEARLTTEWRTFMDRRGEGVPIVLDRSEAISGLRPEYRLIDDAELALTIFAAEPG